MIHLKIYDIGQKSYDTIAVNQDKVAALTLCRDLEEHPQACYVHMTKDAPQAKYVSIESAESVMKQIEGAYKKRHG